MGRRYKAIALISAAFLALGGSAFAADGDGGDSTVTAVVASATGERFVSAAPPVVLARLAGTATMTGALVLGVTELARTGTASWSLQAQLDADLSDGGDNSIARSQMSMDTGTTVPVGGGGEIASGSDGTLDAEVTVFTNTGQLTTLAYTGVYTSTTTLSLTIPNLQPTGAYSGNISITLVQ
jgi:hypothetical protein